MLDITLGETHDFKFNTAEPDTGAPITLAGSPVVAAYVDNSTTEITAGITLTTDFDSRVGLHNVRVVASGGNGYATGTTVALVLTAGTVDAISAVGCKVAEFTIGRQASLALRPTTAGRTLDVAATGEAGIDFDNILLTNGAPKAGVHASGTLSGTHSTTTADLGANAPGASQIVVGMTLYFPAHSLAVLVTSYNTGTGVATFDTVTVTLVDGNVWFLFPTAAVSGGAAPSAATVAAAVWDLATSGHTTSGTFGEQVKTDIDTIVTATGAAAIRTAVGLASANLDTQLTTIDDFLDTEVVAIKAKTDQLTFTTANMLDSAIKRVGNTTLTTPGTGGQGYGA